MLKFMRERGEIKIEKEKTYGKGESKQGWNVWSKKKEDRKK